MYNEMSGDYEIVERDVLHPVIFAMEYVSVKTVLCQSPNEKSAKYKCQGSRWC